MVSAYFQWLLDEAYGYYIYTLCTFHIQQMRILSAKCDADLETHKNEPILKKPIVQNFTLNNNDPIFTKFRDYMYSVVMESVEGIYGNFS